VLFSDGACASRGVARGSFSDGSFCFECFLIFLYIINFCHSLSLVAALSRDFLDLVGRDSSSLVIVMAYRQ
jgi:hypothetical protein